MWQLLLHRAFGSLSAAPQRRGLVALNYHHEPVAGDTEVARGAARGVARPETRAADPATPRRPRSPPSVLVDSRLAQFREMGFDAAAAEAALAAANNDVDAALTALLAAKADE